MGRYSLILAHRLDFQEDASPSFEDAHERLIERAPSRHDDFDTFDVVILRCHKTPDIMKINKYRQR